MIARAVAINPIRVTRKMATLQAGELTRTVKWHDPAATRALVHGLSGLEVMRGIRDGLIPGPPLALLIGFRCIGAEPGEVVMTLDYDPSLENSIGMLHGATTAAMLDTAMAAAANTMLPIGAAVVTLDLTLTYLRPARAENAPIVATGTVANQGRRSIYALGEVRDNRGRLMVHAVGNFSVVNPVGPHAQ